MSRRCEWYTAQQVCDHLGENFAIPEDGFDSDIKGFESDSDDDLGYVHTKPDKFENATFAMKMDKMFSVHINRFQTV